MVESDELKASVIKLRSICGNYPVRFTADISGLSYSTVNRFINGDNPKLSTVLRLLDIAQGDDLIARYERWRGMNSNTEHYIFKTYRGK